MIILETLIDVHSNITVVTIIVSPLLSCLLQTIRLVHLHLFSVGGILLGKCHSVQSLTVLSSPWSPDILFCSEYFTNKHSVKSDLNFRWSTFCPIFLCDHRIQNHGINQPSEEFFVPFIHSLPLQCCDGMPLIYPRPLVKNISSRIF